MGLFSCGTSDCSNGTFTYCNMSPQNESLNGNNWAKLELGSRNCASNNSIVVYTGPLFLKNKYWCTKKGNCVGNECEKFLHPSSKNGGDLDWYITALSNKMRQEKIRFFLVQ